jgi:hypothetical protein
MSHTYATEEYMGYSKALCNNIATDRGCNIITAEKRFSAENIF